MAPHDVIVDHTERLHGRIHGGGADEREAPLLQLFAERHRLWSHCFELRQIAWLG